jgi:hypothetical protein
MTFSALQTGFRDTWHPVLAWLSAFPLPDLLGLTTGSDMLQLLCSWPALCMLIMLC